MNPVLEKLLPWCRRTGEGCLVWGGRREEWGPAAKAVVGARDGQPPPNAVRVTAGCGTALCLAEDHLALVPLDPEDPRGLKQHEINALKTECPHGHPYNKANTKYERDKKGSLCRRCRECDRIRHRLKSATRIL